MTFAMLRDTWKIYFVHSRIIIIIISCFTFHNVHGALVSGLGFCSETIHQRFETECTSCHINVFVDCPSGSVKETRHDGNSGCEYEQYLGPGPNITRDGCTHTCRRNVTVDQCCKGFWGPKCNECPGGYSKPCSNHGTCSDMLNGTGECACDVGWSGHACEFCTNSSLVSENCTQPVDFSPCQNITCPDNSACTVVDSEAVCMCSWPYVEHENGTSNSSDVVCKKIDICTLPPLCHTNARCVMSESEDVTGLNKNCTCVSGFHGDGYECDPIDPCQTNNGGCDLETSDCVFVEPGKSNCFCKDGYQKDILDDICSLIDICTKNESACHPRATCETVAPNNVRCQCREGYEGDGQVCYGNILQVIRDLDENDSELQGQMTLIQGAIEKYYMAELTRHAPFTMFVPTNEGFRALNAIDYQKWLDDKVRVRQILRQHILVGEFTTDKLVNSTEFYTLQCSKAELLVASRSDSLRFRIFGSNKKAKLVRENVVASNGIIHIINRIMTNTPSNTGDETKTIYENIKLDGKYNRFQTLVDSLGNDLRALLDSPNVTVLLPNNAAFDALPTGSLDYLMSTEGKGHLTALLKNHIFKGVIEITDIINMRRLISSSGISSYIQISETGQIQLNNGVSITQSDIAASNGLFHDLDAVLISDDISILPNNCDQRSFALIMGPCGDCRESARCFPPDVPSNTTNECQYYAKNSAGKYETRPGCALMCNRTYITPQCCKGFYGFDCLPCPGGHKNPCNGRGKCDEGYYNEGTCTCDAGFGGAACEACADDKHFGVNCTEECTCLHGKCYSGPEGDGMCLPFTCDFLHTGDNCDIQIYPCNDQLHRCHAHALCIWEEKQLEFRCICKPGYEGNGFTCKEIDPCLKPDRGGCHSQASCIYAGPGQSNCTCNEGWTGDGTFCHAETTCSKHVECHKHAQCIPSEPGKHICQCKDGFEGNGSYCLYKDRCEVNNGGCHPKAICSHDDRSAVYVNCSCPVDQGYSGNGYSCHGNIIMEIENNPKLTAVAKLFLAMSASQQLLLTDRNYTVFVGTDQALFNLEKTYQHKYEHWMKPENLITLLNYHTLLGSYKLDGLVALSKIKKLETMADGFSIYVSKGSDGRFRLMPQRTGTVATIIESDIIATNGYFNIIDQFVEPYEPTDPDDYPDLETFFGNHTEYSTFAQWLQDKGLIDKLTDEMDSYTLFVLNNTVASTINVTVTTDFLRYYIIPVKQMMVSTDDNTTIITDLGAYHQLIFNKPSYTEIMVNKIKITKPDMFTFGGLVNEIAAPLYAVLHECNERIEKVTMGPCTKCNGNIYQCIGNASSVPDGQIVGCVYTEKVVFRVEKKTGCQGPCLYENIVKGCCSGYYGKDCNECSGGPEVPCSGHGTCNDGLKGDGTCTCHSRFKGQKCDSCIDGWDGSNCEIDTTGCGYKNGGCDKNALCTRQANGVITCTCRGGFHGDGKNCTGPCDVNNGGCDTNATCTYSNSDSVTCQCLSGLVGDGQNYCLGDILASLLTIPNTDTFYDSLLTFSRKGPLSVLRSPVSTKYITLFVPRDSSYNGGNKLLLEDILQQTVLSEKKVALLSVDFTNTTLTSLSNKTVTITYDEQTHTFYANSIRVIQGNIEFTNGVVHLMEKPFSSPSAVQSLTGAATFSTAAVVTVVIVAVVALLGIAVVLYRKSKSGYWDVLNKWLASRQSLADSQAASLNDDDGEDGETEHTSGLPRDSSFGNPLYTADDL